MSHTIGIDVGGTFTDFVVTTEGQAALRVHKSPSTPHDPSEGVLIGLQEIAGALGFDLGTFLADTPLIVHGTTVTTNALLTNNGARTGLLTTDGFRDVLEMRRGIRSRHRLYDNRYVAPRPLVPRDRRLPVRERVDAAGTVLAPLDLEQARSAIKQLVDLDVSAIAICLMHAYANPEHERALAAMVEELAPDCSVSVSSDVLPQIRLYERVSTTAMSAYVGPVLRRYVERLVRQLSDVGFGGILLVMQSNGGVALPEIVTGNPASTVLSGPAGGPVAGLTYARGAGSSNCLVVDMGGTSYDVSMVRNGQVQVSHDGELNRHAVALPMIDVHTIGAGGGSIGWIDAGTLLRMGPQSAGADPGPAAYGRGGIEPTSTDADIVLGYLDPDFFLGGRIRLRADLAEEAIATRIGRPLGLSVEEAAAAMYEVITLVMAAGTKDMALQRGVDPSEFPLVAAGGAGPLHVGMIAHELGIDTVIVPPTSAVLCALGMILADLRHDYVQAHRVPWDELDVDAVRELLAGMRATGAATLAREGVGADRRRFLAGADIRYAGQHHEVRVTFPLEDLENSADGIERVEAAFHRRHEELYGFSSPARALELIGLHGTALGERRRPSLEVVNGAGGTPPPPKRWRRAWLPTLRTFADVEVFDGAALGPATAVHGPCIVERETTTVFIPEDFELRGDELGSLIMTRDARGGRER